MSAVLDNEFGVDIKLAMVWNAVMLEGSWLSKWKVVVKKMCWWMKW